MEIIKTQNLSKKYNPTDKSIFNNLNILFVSGTINLITGPSGCGKTTLFNMLSLQDFDYEGNIYLCNKDIKTFSLIERCLVRNQYFGFVYQNYGLIKNRTVKENILMPSMYSNKEYDEKWYIDLLSILELEKLENKQINFLSGGEKQRIAIARALILKPKIVFLDEPFSNLDNDKKNKLIDQLKILSSINKTTIILISHDVPKHLLEVIDQQIDLEKYNE